MGTRLIRTALIGRGMAGTVFHAPLIRAVPELELAAVAGSADAAAAIADPATDLVVVATPNSTHFPLAAAALEAGKHVVIDKPFAVTSAEADALIALAAERGRMLTVFHNRRWDGDFMSVRALVEAGRLGEVALFEAHWDRFRPAIKQGWRETEGEGTGLFFDLGPHMIDQALQLFGPPEAVTADIAVQRAAARVDDYFHVTLRYGRMRAILSASTLSAKPRPRFLIFGSEGAFEKHGLDPQEAALKAGGVPEDPGFGEDEPRLHGVFTDAQGISETVPTVRGRYLSFYEGVAEAILRGGAPPVDPADARLGLRIVELARLSAAEGRTVSLDG
jgi:scyllo-inositol 2-dehydrogenase (NADP+)